ncbi:MAG: thiamine ABC transporter substrate-binding protein [Candidatus Heimdallarchaeota archaeon]
MNQRLRTLSYLSVLLFILVLLPGEKNYRANARDDSFTISSVKYASEILGKSEEKLTIATYESLMAWGEAGLDNDSLEITWDEIKEEVFNKFASDHNISVEIRHYADAGEMLQALIFEKDSLSVDIVIGLDNTLAHEGINEGLFQKYTPDNISVIPQWARDGLDTTGYLTPYDFGVIALIQHKGDLALGDNFTLQTILEQDLAAQILTQNPATSSTGLAFLLWTVSVYEKILQQPWQDWWKAVSSEIHVTKGWSDSWTLWDEGEGSLLVSYGTDPAYSNYFWGSTDIEAFVSHESGNPNGWVQIEGLGITTGVASSMLPVAKEFVDWFISEDVQSLIPTTNWMFPANQYAKLPEAFNYAIHPDNITILNGYWTSAEIATNLGSWRESWEEIMVVGDSESTPIIYWPAILGLSTIPILRRIRRAP